MSWLINDISVQRYNDSLIKAGTTDAFESFRKLDVIREIVEGIPDIVGHGYYQKLKLSLGDEKLTNEWLRITKNDDYGNPNLVEFEQHRNAASTTMRYAWNVVDMQNNKIALSNADIIEVGGGYGGLCRMIHEYHTPKSYTIIDIPEALALVERYLSKFSINVRLISCDDYDYEPIDTFISNYALTELSLDLQQEYADKLIKRASNGYITYNSQPREAKNQYSLNDLKSMVSNAYVNDENIKRSECQVLVWSST